jgi:hypothetical protein
MEEHLRVAGRSISLRRTTVRWLEYAIAAWVMALVILFLSRFGNVDLVPVVVMLVLAGVVCAMVALANNARFLESARREQVLARERREKRPASR